MAEFIPDYSSPQALKASCVRYAEEMRQAASDSKSEIGKATFIEAAEAAEDMAKQVHDA